MLQTVGAAGLTARCAPNQAVAFTTPLLQISLPIAMNAAAWQARHRLADAARAHPLDLISVADSERVLNEMGLERAVLDAMAVPAATMLPAAAELPLSRLVFNR